MSKGQKAKFIEAAQEVGTSEDEDVFDRALKKVAKAPPTDAVQDRKKNSPETKKPAK